MLMRRWYLSAALLAAGAAVAALCLAALFPDVPETSGSPLGFVVIDISDEEAASSYHVEELGVYVLAVDEGSHAHREGIQTGDRLLRVNGVAIDHSAELVDLQESFRNDQPIRMDFVRSDAHFEATLIWKDHAVAEEEGKQL